jgi:hypothetical protein
MPHESMIRIQEKVSVGVKYCTDALLFNNINY